MKKDYLYFGFLAIVILLYVVFQVFGPKPIDWTQTYINKDKIPYGTFILYNELESLFPDQKSTVNLDPLFISLEDDYYNTAFEDEPVASSRKRNWIFINQTLGTDYWETELLMNEVSQGNHVFMAAYNIEGQLADTLNIETDYYYTPFEADKSDNSLVYNFSNPSLLKNGGWVFKDIERTFFEKVDTSKTTILGTNQFGEVNFIKVQHGEGAFFFHTSPTLFTNFYLRNPTQATYAFTALSYLPVRFTIWDEYYKSYRETNRSPMRYILSNPPLKHAWFLGLAAIVLFMFFRSKREQRIIPVRNRPKNTTISFAQTVGSLYLEEGTHKAIFEKKYHYFLEYVRSNLNLDTTKISTAFIQKLSQRSGIEENEIFSLFDLIEVLERKPEITEKELITITQRIDRFYNQSLR
ncbi:MAG: DUF4350 domain-containing protein [Balneola sp.]